MPKTTIDELLQAIEAVQIIQKRVDRHEQAIERIIDRLDQFEKRLSAAEAGGRA